MTDEPNQQEFTEESLPDEMPEEWITLLAGGGSRIVLSASVVRIEDGMAWFDIGSKFESSIPLTDWEDEDPPKVGDVFRVMIDEDCDVADRPLKIIRVEVRVDPMHDLDKIIKSLSVGQVYAGILTRRIRDGFLVDIGVNAFLPDDCVPAEMKANPDAFIEQEIRCRVTSIDQERRVVCVAIEGTVKSISS